MTQTKLQPFFIPLSIIVAGALVAAGIYFSGGVSITGTGANNEPPAEGAIPKVRAFDASRDHIRGNKNAKVVVIEYSDLQCPYCQQFHTTMKQIMDKYGTNGDVAWVFRNFPLSSIHPEARPAALAAECVAKLKGNDAYWRFADGVFTEQATIGNALYTKLAQAEGISAADLTKCVADPATAKRVSDDEQEILGQGAQGTPFSVVFQKGKAVNVIPGALPYDSVLAGIEGLLK